MAVRNDVIDKSRQIILKYIIENKVTFQEWEFINRYIEQIYDAEKNEVTISNGN